MSVLSQHLVENPVSCICSRCAGSLPRGAGGFLWVGVPSPYLLQGPLFLPTCPLGNGSPYPEAPLADWCGYETQVPLVKMEQTLQYWIHSESPANEARDRFHWSHTSLSPVPAPAWPPCSFSLLSWKLSFNKPPAQESPSQMEGDPARTEWFKVLSNKKNVISYISLPTFSSLKMEPQFVPSWSHGFISGTWQNSCWFYNPSDLFLLLNTIYSALCSDFQVQFQFETEGI